MSHRLCVNMPLLDGPLDQSISGMNGPGKSNRGCARMDTVTTVFSLFLVSLFHP